MLDHWGDAPGHEAVDGGAAHRRDCAGPLGKGAVADHPVRLGMAQVEAGSAVGVDPHIRQLLGHQAVVQVDGLDGGAGIALVELAKLPRRLAQHGQRRLQPLHPSAFLIDEHQRFRVVDSLAQGFGQTAHLVRILDVAGEQNEAPGPDVPEEGPLIRRQGEALATQDAGSVAHFTKHAWLEAFRASQKAPASALDAKPPT